MDNRNFTAIHDSIHRAACTRHCAWFDVNIQGFAKTNNYSPVSVNTVNNQVTVRSKTKQTRNLAA